MLPKLIAEVFHARLHTYNKELRLNSKMTISEFINSNKDIVNAIALGMMKEYDLDRTNPNISIAMQKGMKLYVR